MRDAVRQSGKRVCYVSGADLAHMGRKFGDEFGVSEALIESTRARDGELLDFAARLDAEGFFQHVAREKDARKICGLPPTYMALVCMDAARSQLLKHDWNVESETDSLVSFCSMAFYIEQD